MVIDTSALIAILANEPEAELLEAAIDADPIRLISAASVTEAAIVVERATAISVAGSSICYCTRPGFRSSR